MEETPAGGRRVAGDGDVSRRRRDVDVGVYRNAHGISEHRTRALVYIRTLAYAPALGNSLAKRKARNKNDHNTAALSRTPTRSP